MLTLIPVSTLFLGLAAYLTPPGSPGQARFVSRNPRALLTVAAALTLANLPWTAVFIIPRMHQLKKIEKEVFKGELCTLGVRFGRLGLTKVGNQATAAGGGAGGGRTLGRQ